jgi:hypothetical protein
VKAIGQQPQRAPDGAPIYDGVHYRTSTEVGTELGRKVGELAAAKYLRRPD